jgi:hypothetical protein
MRILDNDRDSACSDITLYLLPKEAEELISSLQTLLARLGKAGHHHIPSDDFQKEITVCIYNPESLEEFNSRSIKLIKQDK